MTNAEIVADAARRATSLLSMLEATGLPGNVVVQFHRDSTRIKKVIITHEESWLVPGDPAQN